MARLPATRPSAAPPITSSGRCARRTAFRSAPRSRAGALRGATIRRGRPRRYTREPPRPPRDPTDSPPALRPAAETTSRTWTPVQQRAAGRPRSTMSFTPTRASERSDTDARQARSRARAGSDGRRARRDTGCGTVTMVPYCINGQIYRPQRILRKIVQTPERRYLGVGQGFARERSDGRHQQEGPHRQREHVDLTPRRGWSHGRCRPPGSRWTLPRDASIPAAGAVNRPASPGSWRRGRRLRLVALTRRTRARAERALRAGRAARRSAGDRRPPRSSARGRGSSCRRSPS